MSDKAFLLAMVALLWLATAISILLWFRDKARAGAVPEAGTIPGLNVPPDRRGFLGLVLAGQVVLVLSAEDAVRLDRLTSLLLGLGLLTGFGFRYGVSAKCEIRERGVLMDYLLPWHHIQGYQWEEETPSGRTLRLFLSRRSFWLRAVTLTVPFADRDAADQFLR